MHTYLYSDNQKILEQDVDFQTQVKTLNSPMNMRTTIVHAMQADPFHLISDLTT